LRVHHGVLLFIGGTLNLRTLNPFSKKLNQFYRKEFTLSRSAGNYLAGLNGGTARSMIGGITRYSMMKLAGAVHHETFSFKLALRVHILGDKYGPPPYYGEIDYAGRMILKGFSDGRSK
jgi:hypothetical protein